MAAQHSIELLELRVSEMIERLKSLRLEKVNLSAEIHQQKSDLRQLHEERRVVRKRLEKILGTINHVEGKESAK